MTTTCVAWTWRRLGYQIFMHWVAATPQAAQAEADQPQGLDSKSGQRRCLKRAVAFTRQRFQRPDWSDAKSLEREKSEAGGSLAPEESVTS